MLRNNLSKESIESTAKDLVAEAYDLRRATQETSLELEAINQNYDSSALDMINI